MKISELITILQSELVGPYGDREVRAYGDINGVKDYFPITGYKYGKTVLSSTFDLMPIPGDMGSSAETMVDFSKKWFDSYNKRKGNNIKAISKNFYRKENGEYVINKIILLDKDREIFTICYSKSKKTLRDIPKCSLIIFPNDILAISISHMREMNGYCTQEFQIIDYSKKYVNNYTFDIMNKEKQFIEYYPNEIY